MKTMIIKHYRHALVLSLLTSSSLAMAANYEVLDSHQHSFKNLEQITPDTPEQGHSISIIDSFHQSTENNKKNQVLEALRLFKENKLDDAQKIISDLLQNNPNVADYHNLNALLETLKKNPTAAQQNYDQTIKLDPKNIMAYLGSAKLALDNGQLDKAKDYANKALSINDKTLNAYLVLADVAYKQKDNAEIEKLLQTAQDKVKGNITEEIDVIKNAGKYYALQKQPEKILALTEELRSRYPYNTSVLSLLAQVQIINNKKSLAEETLLKLISLDKENISNRLLLIKLMSEQPDKEQETLKLLDETAQLTPNNLEALIYKTAYLIKLKQTPEALKLADKIDSLFPKLVLGKLLKGDVYLADKKLDKASEMYQKAYNIEPNDRILFIIVDLLVIQNKQANAIKLLNNALEKNNKNIAVHFKLATIYQQQNNTQQAEAHYKAMLAQQADNALALNNLAVLYSQQNDPQALEYGKKAYEKAPESAAVLDTYGSILVKQNQAKEGLVLLEKAAGLALKEPNIQFHLAESYVANNNPEKAIEILAPLVQAEADFTEKKAATDLLEKLKVR
jgi:putative PEP-CTERM system TPR-repeat lipoprotein